jgi:hypothetical protein
MVSKKLLMFGPLPIRIVAGITFIVQRISIERDVLKREIFPRGSSGIPKKKFHTMLYCQEGLLYNRFREKHFASIIYFSVLVEV